MFANHVRADLKREYPSESSMEITKRAAERWNRMSQAEKERPEAMVRAALPVKVVVEMAVAAAATEESQGVKR